MSPSAGEAEISPCIKWESCHWLGSARSGTDLPGSEFLLGGGVCVPDDEQSRGEQHTVCTSQRKKKALLCSNAPDEQKPNTHLFNQSLSNYVTSSNFIIFSTLR